MECGTQLQINIFSETVKFSGRKYILYWNVKILSFKLIVFLKLSGFQVEKYLLYWNVDVCDKEASHRKTKDRLKHEATVHVSLAMLLLVICNL